MDSKSDKPPPDRHVGRRAMSVVHNQPSDVLVNELVDGNRFFAEFVVIHRNATHTSFSSSTQQRRQRQQQQQQQQQLLLLHCVAFVVVGEDGNTHKDNDGDAAAAAAGAPRKKVRRDETTTTTPSWLVRDDVEEEEPQWREWRMEVLFAFPLVDVLPVSLSVMYAQLNISFMGLRTKNA